VKNEQPIPIKYYAAAKTGETSISDSRAHNNEDTGDSIVTTKDWFDVILHQHTIDMTSGSTGSGEEVETIPPYYALVYLMYIGD
jgi:hypothetical protein